MLCEQGALSPSCRRHGRGACRRSCVLGCGLPPLAPEAGGVSSRSHLRGIGRGGPGGDACRIRSEAAAGAARRVLKAQGSVPDARIAPSRGGSAGSNMVDEVRRACDAAPEDPAGITYQTGPPRAPDRTTRPPGGLPPTSSRSASSRRRRCQRDLHGDRTTAPAQPAPERARQCPAGTPNPPRRSVDGRACHRSRGKELWVGARPDCARPVPENPGTYIDKNLFMLVIGINGASPGSALGSAAFGRGGSSPPSRTSRSTLLAGPWPASPPAAMSARGATPGPPMRGFAPPRPSRPGSAAFGRGGSSPPPAQQGRRPEPPGQRQF
jgi:hypothetical protein